MLFTHCCFILQESRGNWGEYGWQNSFGRLACQLMNALIRIIHIWWPMRSDERIDRFWLPKLFGTHVQKQHFRFYFRSEFVFAGSLGERQALVFAFCFRKPNFWGSRANHSHFLRCDDGKMSRDRTYIRWVNLCAFWRAMFPKQVFLRQKKMYWHRRSIWLSLQPEYDHFE